jgi:hypothetical protein
MHHGHNKVKILQVDGLVPCSLGRYYDVEAKCDSDHVDSGCAAVPWVIDPVTANCEACAIWVILFRMKVHTDVPICAIFEASNGYVVVFDEKMVSVPLLMPGMPWARFGGVGLAP